MDCSLPEIKCVLVYFVKTKDSKEDLDHAQHVHDSAPASAPASAPTSAPASAPALLIRLLSKRHLHSSLSHPTLLYSIHHPPLWEIMWKDFVDLAAKSGETEEKSVEAAPYGAWRRRS